MSVHLHFLHQTVRESKCQVLAVPNRLGLVDDAVVGRGEDDDVRGLVVERFGERDEVMNFHAEGVLLFAYFFSRHWQR